MSELVWYFFEAILLYFKSLSWSIVKSGFGNNWNTLADIVAAKRGSGTNNLFLPIKCNNFFKIIFKDKMSGPTHSTILE